MNDPQPKVIFFDAVGTLFGVRGSVGEVYRQIARQFGVDISAEVLNRAFMESFRTAPRCTFPGADPKKIPTLEFEWWEAVALRTFDKAGVLEQFSYWAGFFRQLYDRFATAEPWFVYADIPSTLERYQSLGIELGVLSNFDSRLHAVLQELELADFFSSVTISTEVGAAKPDPLIFATALAKHNCAPQEAWHVGDSRRDDYEGANTAGLRGILLERNLQGYLQGNHLQGDILSQAD